MQLLVADGQRQAAEAARRGDKVAVWGPSPGFRELRWIKPVLAGDTISFASEVAGKRNYIGMGISKSIQTVQVLFSQRL